MSMNRLLFIPVLALALAATPAMAQDSDGYGSVYNPATTAANVFESRVSGLENQLRALTGKVEQLEFANRQLRQLLDRQQSDNDMRLKALEQQNTIRNNIDASTNAHDASELATPGRSADTATVNNFGRPGSDTDEDQNSGGTAQEQYDRAFSLLRQADYDNAEATFKSFIANHPDDKLIDNAKYWLAETYYVRSKFQEAAVAFAESYQIAPGGTKAPDSLLKLAMSLSALNNTKDACTTLSELRNKFPNASGSVKNRAEQETQRLKCGQAAIARNAPAKKPASKSKAN